MLNCFKNLNEHHIVAGWWGWSREVLQGFRETPQETCMCPSLAHYLPKTFIAANIFIHHVSWFTAGVWRVGSWNCKAILIKLLNFMSLHYNMQPKVWDFVGILRLSFYFLDYRNYVWVVNNTFSSRVHVMMILILYGRKSYVWDMINQNLLLIQYIFFTFIVLYSYDC